MAEEKYASYSKKPSRPTFDAITKGDVEIFWQLYNSGILFTFEIMVLNAGFLA